MKRTIFFLFIVVAAAINFFAAAEAREWTSKHGHKFEAEFVKLSGDVVHLKTADGEEAEVKREELCDEDKIYVAAKVSGKSVEELTDKVRIVTIVTGHYVGWDSDTSFFVTKDGTLWGMGRNADKQLGVSTQEKNVKTPIRIASDVANVTTNGATTLILKKDGTLWGMGWSENNGKDKTSQIFAHKVEKSEVIYPPILLDKDVIDVSVAEMSSAWIKRDGSLWADGKKIATGGVKSVAAGDEVFFYIKNDNALYCHGHNRLINKGFLNPPRSGSFKNQHVMSDVAKVKFFGRYVGDTYCTNVAILKTDGTLWIYFTENRKCLLRQFETDVVDMSVTLENIYYVKKDGQLFSMAISDDDKKRIPIHIDTDVIRVAAAVGRSANWGSALLYIKKDNTLWSSGKSYNGALGLGDTTATKHPAQVKLPQK